MTSTRIKFADLGHDEIWVLSSPYDREECRRRIGLLIDGKRGRHLLDLQSEFAGIPGAPTNPTGFPVVSEGSSRIWVGETPYPPILEGMLFHQEFSLYPAGGDLPFASGMLTAVEKGTRIDLTLRDAGETRVGLSVLATIMTTIWSGALIALVAGGFRVHPGLFVPLVAIPFLLALLNWMLSTAWMGRRLLAEMVRQALAASVDQAATKTRNRRDILRI